MNFQGHLENVYRLIREAPLVLLLGGLLVQILIALTFGLLAGPLMGGFLLMIVAYFRTGRRPLFNDLFTGLQRFGQLFPFFFLGLLIMFGFFLFVIPGVIFTTWWLYALLLMADRKMPLGQAMRMSRRKVGEKGFFMHLVFLFMITIIPTFLVNLAAGIIPPLEVLQFFLFPLQMGLLASLYLEQFEGRDPTAAFGVSPARLPASTPEEERDARRGLD